MTLKLWWAFLWSTSCRKKWQQRK